MHNSNRRVLCKPLKPSHSQSLALFVHRSSSGRVFPVMEHQWSSERAAGTKWEFKLRFWEPPTLAVVYTVNYWLGWMFPWKAILVKFPQNLNPSEVDPLAFHCLVSVSFLTVNYRKPELLNHVPCRPVQILQQNKFSFTSLELKGWSFHQETGFCPLLWKMNHVLRHDFFPSSVPSCWNSDRETENIQVKRKSCTNYWRCCFEVPISRKMHIQYF